MWVRNGYSVANLALNYVNKDFRDSMYEPDLSLLQICSSLFPDPDALIAVLVDRFDIESFLQIYDFIEPPLEKELDQLKINLGLLEGLLETIISIISYRFRIGKYSDEEKIRQNLIQHLFLGPQTHSSLAK